MRGPGFLKWRTLLFLSCLLDSFILYLRLNRVQVSFPPVISVAAFGTRPAIIPILLSVPLRPVIPVHRRRFDDFFLLLLHLFNNIAFLIAVAVMAVRGVLEFGVPIIELLHLFLNIGIVEVCRFTAFLALLVRAVVILLMGQVLWLVIFPILLPMLVKRLKCAPRSPLGRGFKPLGTVVVGGFMGLLRSRSA